MVQKSILLIAMLNNNHLSNVRTLQSIYSQTHPEIYLVICNDAIPKFDCERIIYNLFDKPDNIKGIYLKENRYPLGGIHERYHSCRRFRNSFISVD